MMKVFCNIDIILHTHKELLKSLKGSNAFAVGGVFNKRCGYFTVYSQYGKITDQKKKNDDLKK
jgi:hypothetical protein